MAIRSIPETIQQQPSNDVESRGENLPCPYLEISGENQRQQESSINMQVTENSIEYWLCMMNTPSYVMLIVAILANNVGLLINEGNPRISFCRHLFSCEWNVPTFSALSFSIAFFIIFWVLMACNCCSFDTDPTKDTDREFSLTGSLIRNGTFALLMCCLMFAVLGMGDEQIKTLSWNMMTNNIKQYHNTTIQEESFDYELKPSDPTANNYVFSWNGSLDVYDISSTMNDLFLDLNATKEFLNRHNCDSKGFPTLALQHVSIFGPMGAFNRYTAIDLACYPIHEQYNSQ